MTTKTRGSLLTFRVSCVSRPQQDQVIISPTEISSYSEKDLTSKSIQAPIIAETRLLFTPSLTVA